MENHKTADPKDLEYKTDPFSVSVGIEPTSLKRPRPDLNGLRVKSPAADAIYLIDEGLKRHIPNPSTYNNLFRDWNGIIIDINIDEIADGTPITNGAILSRPDGGTTVYLVDNNVKRHVTSPTVMVRYNFSWDRVYNVPPVLLNFIPTGQRIVNP